jgi:hypothetical protein
MRIVVDRSGNLADEIATTISRFWNHLDVVDPESRALAIAERHRLGSALGHADVPPEGIAGPIPWDPPCKRKPEMVAHQELAVLHAYITGPTLAPRIVQTGL